MASYNCSDSTITAYGGGNYGTCTNQTVGVPNTGFFSNFFDNEVFLILAPLAGAILLTAFASLLIRRKKA